jgi:ABC-2 type transport system permease protein
MKPVFIVMKTDLRESFRSRWFLLYTLIFAGLVAVLFASGVTDSRVMGFTGLTRLLLIFIQACNIILPIFILITTVRSIAGDRDSHILEYMLSFPVSLRAYYWGKFLGRLATVLIPLLFAMLLALVLGFAGAGVPWRLTALYTLLLLCSALTFLGMGFFISCLARSQEMAVGTALFVWLLLTAFIDIILIGFMIKTRVMPEIIFSLALINPVQIFRIAAISLFDPVLSVIGPASFFILDKMGRGIFLLYAFSYTVSAGIVFAALGYMVFKKKDLM